LTPEAWGTGRLDPGEPSGPQDANKLNKNTLEIPKGIPSWEKTLKMKIHHTKNVGKGLII